MLVFAQCSLNFSLSLKLYKCFPYNDSKLQLFDKFIITQHLFKQCQAVKLNKHTGFFACSFAEKYHEAFYAHVAPLI